MDEIKFKKETLIKTDKSFLDFYKVKNNKSFKKLVKLCIEDVKDKLNIKPEIIIKGKICHQSRDVAFFSNESIGYQYSGQLSKSKELTNNLEKLLKFINNMFNSNFNGILINRYNNGSECIGRHSDDERNLDSVGVVAISYGSKRKFRVHNKFTKKKVMDILTKKYSIIHMGGQFQKEFTHEIPKELKVLDYRYSLTFRKHLK